MNATLAGVHRSRPVPAAIGKWQEHLSGRLIKKIDHFERIIAGFRQRRWS